jgi:hypothetical protein
VAHNFQTGKNKIKLLREYESVTQLKHQPIQCCKLFFLVKSVYSLSILFYFYLNIIGHEAPDINLESLCTCTKSINVLCKLRVNTNIIQKMKNP